MNLYIERLCITYLFQDKHASGNSAAGHGEGDRPTCTILILQILHNAVTHACKVNCYIHSILHCCRADMDVDNKLMLVFMLTLLQMSCKTHTHCKAGALSSSRLGQASSATTQKLACKHDSVNRRLNLAGTASHSTHQGIWTCRRKACMLLSVLKLCMNTHMNLGSALTTCNVLASTTSGMLASIAKRGKATRQCSTSALVSTLPTKVPCLHRSNVSCKIRSVT